MSIDEHELRERLAAVAAQVTEPRFTVEAVARRIRRRRARIITMVSGPVLAVAGLALALALGLVGPGTGSRPASPPPAPVWLPIKISVHGQVRLVPRLGILPRFVIAPGEHVQINVDVTVPKNVRVEALWLGIVKAERSSLGPAGPIGWTSVLVRISEPMTPGSHTFNLRWVAPGGLRPGRTLHLIAFWVTGHSQAAPIIANLIVQRGVTSAG